MMSEKKGEALKFEKCSLCGRSQRYIQIHGTPNGILICDACFNVRKLFAEDIEKKNVDVYQMGFDEFSGSFQFQKELSFKNIAGEEHMDAKTKKEIVEAFQGVIGDILDKFDKYKPKDKVLVKAVLEHLKVLNKELDRYDRFIKNFFDNRQRKWLNLINTLDKVITKKEQQSYVRDFASLISDVLDKYEKYTPEDKAKVQSAFNKLLETNEKLEDYDLNIAQRAWKAFKDNFGVK